MVMGTRIRFVGIALALLVARAPVAGAGDVASPTASAVTDQVRWASGVVAFSSQYSSPGWAAAQALGYPDTYPRYGDFGTTWASATPDGQREFLELSFDDPSPANYIAVLETLDPGAIDSVYTWNPIANHYDLVWSAAAVAQSLQARLWAVTFPTTAYAVSRVRLAINSPAVSGWNEIDAVGIGANGSIPVQWASGAVASSQYGPVYYTPHEATGPPDVYPGHLDSIHSWASWTSDASREWLQLSYSEAEPVSRVDVFETFHPGAIDSIYVRNALDGTLQLVYSALPETLPPAAVRLTVRFPRTPFPVDGVRITLASDVVPGWNEIDAVMISPDSVILILPGITAVPDPSQGLALLHPASPNPFTTSTAIVFELARAGVARVDVFDVRGARIATLAAGAFEPGRHSLTWDGLDDSGHRARAGVYYLQLDTPGARRTRRVVRLD